MRIKIYKYQQQNHISKEAESSPCPYPKSYAVFSQTAQTFNIWVIKYCLNLSFKNKFTENSLYIFKQDIQNVYLDWDLNSEHLTKFYISENDFLNKNSNRNNKNNNNNNQHK